ncbi:MAG: hypothetical protein U1C56_00005 [Candidatus Curtissbacteria bacterium]|nr:hypothetical protein [Candidatus Curtissbacteria bacterium]
MPGRSEQVPIDTGEQQAHPSEVVGASGTVYENIIVADDNLGLTDAIVPNGPSVP